MSNWQPVLDCLQKNEFTEAVALLDGHLSKDPLDVDGRLLRAIAYASSGSLKRAMDDLWKAMAINPASAGTRQALADLFVSGQNPPPDNRDFSLSSGERQMASEVAQIREDHRNRYEFAALWVSRNFKSPQNVTGADVFCGNGYGSRILSGLAGCRMIGIDGSSEAVTCAEQFYGGARTVFRQAYFPFDLAENSIDFAVCFESIEHVEDYESFLQVLDKTTNGPLIISFPIEDTLRFEANRDLFKYHFRHFTIQDMEKLVNLFGRRISSIKGQVVYRIKQDRVNGFLPGSAMELTALREDSQFAVIVAEKS